MGHVDKRNRNGTIRYVARYRDPTGVERSKSFRLKEDAEDFVVRMEAAKLDRTWIDPVRSRATFESWAGQWWEVWSSNPHRSPKTLQTVEARLRLHLQPAFGSRRLDSISVQDVARWQNSLLAARSFYLTVACRTILYQVMQAAESDRLIPTNPVRGVPAPKQPVDPEVVFGRVRLRMLTPIEAGRLLAAASPFSRDHFLILLGTGMRAGEFCGLRIRRVDLTRRRIEVLDTRFEAGRTFGNGYKNRPKSDAGIRWVPLAPAVLDAIGRQLGSVKDPKALAFCGPGGGNGVPAGIRTPVTVRNLRRSYELAASRAGLTGLGHLDLRGPHDLRHTFATWLEDDGIPARVIDELMGHSGARRIVQGGSAIGVLYRHTTPEMEARVVRVIQVRLEVALTGGCTTT